MIESSGRKIWASGAILIALVLCGAVPFADRGVYLDEHLYLHLAKSAIQKDWRFPQDTPWIFFGTPVENLAAHTHPPVGEYLLALMLRLFGGFEEIRFRLLWSVFALLAVLGFYRVARHSGSEPLLITSFFAVAPAFFVLIPTLMMDIPMLAFFLLGLGFYLDNLRGRAVCLLPSAICFLLSAGIGYTAMVPMACLFLWAAAKRRPLRELGLIALTPVMVGVWLVIMKMHFGELPVIGVVRYFAFHASFFENLLPTLTFLGGLSLLPWAFLALVDIPRKPLVAGFSVAAALLASYSRSWPTLPSRLWFVTLASAGIGLLIAFALEGSRRNPAERPPARGLLLLWLPATLLFFLFSAEMVSARYILLSLPPLFLILFHRVRRAAAVPILAATLVLSVLIAAGDYRFVNSYRDWVSRTVVPLQQQGFRLWSAAESGLRFYLEQRGIQTLHKSDIRPRGGDLIVRQESFAYSLSEDLAPLLLPILKMDLTDAFPIRTFVASAGAGFHDSRFGPVPFSLSRAPLDRLELVQVSPLVRSLPQAVPADFSTVPVWYPGGVLLKQVQSEMIFHIRIPENARVEYELEGEGSIEISAECITLRRTGEGPTLWKNLRIVPGSWTAAH